MAPAFSHLSIILRMKPSLTLSVEEGSGVRVRNRKYLRMSKSDHPVETLGPECVLQSADIPLSRSYPVAMEILGKRFAG